MNVWYGLSWLILYFFSPSARAIRCYECTTSRGLDASGSGGGFLGGARADQACSRYVGTSCGYGFFGCVKIATYSGGVDKMGNFIEDPRAVVSLMRGCNMLPVGGVDACQQQTLLGMRILTCYCYSDYCNGVVRHSYRNIAILITISTLTIIACRFFAL